jgi:hypothetical protein
VPVQLTEVWKTYQTYTEELSKVARPLGFGAGGLAWLLRQPDFTFPDPVRWSLLCIVGYFSADLLQYYVGAAVVGAWARRQERRMWKQARQIDGPVDRPRWLDVPARILFHVKIIMLAASYVALAYHIF